MTRIFTALILFFLSPLVSAQDRPDSIVSSHGEIWMAGQPTAEDLADWQSAGVTAVINLRPASEMENVEFNESGVAAELGLTYINIPMPREAYTPETISLISNALGNTNGQVVIHCTIGWRASHSYAAFLIENENMTPQDVIELELWPRSGLDGDMMRLLSPRYAAAYPE